MKHGVKAKHFNRDTQSRKALLRNSLRGLIEHGQIETSEARAKEIRRLADKLINQAQKGDVATRRRIHRYFGKRDVVNTLFDQVVPAVAERKSGFCSLEKLANRRGDNMPVYRLSLLVEEKKWQSLKNDSNKTDKKASASKKTETKKETTKKKK
ncbi:50S ribosomal protein L17 [Candidatus Woesebacteria bacterium]|mgnify:CR=1|jgi:large subunit ribosomal protein L17|nr:50S ribosomal protein L17 [Candidatus Woesebacteria bacterium]HOA11925.1 50S ribosomal protein L17 [Candidatus Woesebacteria bacterium]HOC07567.1 50S ribosomal protein L17 [Candidatus Woesebacteria bacterium]HOI05151.1 50S ribosomal protein L17 [Candidatus Woesebacteria bacterium]HOP39100.1 50S ribosomal protein L17 [Candidatus Woesebacteria bacterium]